MSVHRVCEEVIVIDSLSSDRTVEIAETLGAKVYSQPYLGDGPQKDFGVQFAKNHWILSIDADERLDEDMVREILDLDLDNTPHDAFAFRRKSYIGDRWQKLWYPDYVIRLYNHTKCRYSHADIHSQVEAHSLKKLDSHLIHFSYKDYAQMFTKIRFYSMHGAKKLNKQNKKISTISPLFHAVAAFLKKYLLKGGFRYGLDGLVVSFFAGVASFSKYAFALEEREKGAK